MNQSITKMVAKNPSIKTKEIYTTSFKPFLDAKSKYGRTFGDLTKNALRTLNTGYMKGTLKKTPEELELLTDAQLEEISSGLIDQLFDNALAESRISLKSILREILLNEQDGFDFSDADEIQTKRTQNIKTQQKSVKTNKPQDQKPQDQKLKPDEKKKETPKVKSANKLVRMENGYISCTNSINQLIKEMDEISWGMDVLFNDFGTKKLLYDKNVKVRRGIDKLPLSGIASGVTGVWRGYEQITPDYVNQTERGNGFVDADPVSWYFSGVKPGDVLALKIKDIKVVFGTWNEKWKLTKGLNLFTYAWVVNNKKQGCWVPTTWIEIV
jgi:hypothetical protein